MKEKFVMGLLHLALMMLVSSCSSTKKTVVLDPERVAICLGSSMSIHYGTKDSDKPFFTCLSDENGYIVTKFGHQVMLGNVEYLCKDQKEFHVKGREVSCR
jgi:hypothetical protein